jgi:ribosome recycling factor
MEMIDEIRTDAKQRMEKAIDALHYDLTGIRTGRASPALVERIKVEYYGALTPLNQMASIAIPEPRLIAIRPWDPGALSAIEKAIQKSDLGLTPMNDGKIIRLAIPPLTEERREELVKMMSRRLEEARVAIRNIRREAIESLREYENEKLISEDDMYKGRDQIQELTDDMIARIDEMGRQKETEIRTV